MSVPLTGSFEHAVTTHCSRPRFLEVGSGRVPVVLLHGLFGSPGNWQSIMDDLADRYRFFALQLPIDFNEDRRHTSFQSLGQLTDHVSHFFDEVGLESAVLCGNSLGGHVALDFCLRHPQRVESLVLTGSAGLFERSLSGGKKLRLSRSLVREQATGIFHDPVHVTDELVEDIHSMLADRQYRRFLVRVAKATRDCHMMDELANVHVPTMIIWGRDDTITPPFVAEQFCSHIQGAQLTYIDQCGHAPPIEQPKKFARLLDAFLGSNIGHQPYAISKPR